MWYYTLLRYFSFKGAICRQILQVHGVSNAIQPSHPLSSPSLPAPNPSQHQSLFQWVNSSHEVSKVLEFQLQHHSYQRNPRADLLQNGLVGSPHSPRDSQESSPTLQFKSINSSVLSLPHSPTLTSIHGYWISTWHTWSLLYLNKPFLITHCEWCTLHIS